MAEAFERLASVPKAVTSALAKVNRCLTVDPMKRVQVLLQVLLRLHGSLFERRGDRALD
jgi:hypothetical protein